LHNSISWSNDELTVHIGDMEEALMTLTRRIMGVRRPGRARARAALAGIALLVAACGTSSAPSTTSSSAAPSAAVSAAASGSASAAWEQEWNDLVAAAQAEGSVVFVGPANPELRDALPAAVKERLGIDVEYLSTSRDVAARILSEHQAGVYTVDVVTEGIGQFSGVYGETGTMNGENMGILAPLLDSLILPEVTDPNFWDTSKLPGIEEDQLPLIDPAHEFVFRPINMSGQPITVNADVVPPESVTSWQDLLKPEYQDKIVAISPAQPGPAATTGTLILNELGEDYFRDLYVGQKVLFFDDDRQMADQLVRGGSGIALNLDGATADGLVADGFNIGYVFGLPELPSEVSAGQGHIGMLANAPHPNAAIVLVNWLLSKEGQQLWQDVHHEISMRTDLEFRDEYPEWLRRRMIEPGREYFDGQAWDFNLKVRAPAIERMTEILEEG
jgi:iron(III) transport system substrate-binding protein